MSSNVNAGTSAGSIPPNVNRASDRRETVTPVNFNLSESGLEQEDNSELIMSIPVDVQIVLGSAAMPVSTLMSLGQGSVITLDKKVGDPVEVVVNGRIVAKGEVIVLDEDAARFGVSLTEVLAK